MRGVRSTASTTETARVRYEEGGAQPEGLPEESHDRDRPFPAAVDPRQGRGQQVRDGLQGAEKAHLSGSSAEDFDGDHRESQHGDLRPHRRDTLAGPQPREVVVAPQQACPSGSLHGLLQQCCHFASSADAPPNQ